MARLVVSLLGRMRVTLDGEPVTRFRVQAAQALLAYLAMHAGMSLRRQVLAGLLWPDHPESEALVNLRQALRRLRQAIQDEQASPAFLIATRTTLAFNRESDYWLDVDAFTSAVAAAATTEELSDAADLYRGDFLQGFSLPSALFEEWMVVEREHLHEQALHVLGRLADEYETQGEYARALSAARRQIELEPWRESAHRHAMRCLAASGQRGAALAQYEACRRVLADELGIEPEPETVALYERVRGGLETPAAPSSPSHNLPAQLTPFVGREVLLAEIAACLEDPACRLLTLVGPGGSGKTRLALEVAAAQLDRYPDGVYLVSLAPLQSVEAVVPTIAQTLSFSFYGEGAPKEQLLNYLQQRELLLILDNYEHLLEGVDVATDILRRAPGVKMLVTSRARLNVGSEQLHPISGLEYPETPSQEIVEVGPYGAIELFLSGARRVRPGYQPTGQDLAHVAEICRLVEGMPLALLLAAAWTEMLTPAEVARELGGQLPGRGVDFLATDLRDMPERQRSMRAVFDHSWRLLSPRGQGILARLSVFRGGFTRGAAQQVAGASLRDLMSLINRSLLHRVPTGRYEIHELLRQYAAEKANQPPGTWEATRDDHCAYYVAALAGWAADLKGARQDAALAEMEVEFDNLRVAWEWAVGSAKGRAQAERLDRAVEALGLYYERRVRYEEGERAFREAADRLAEVEQESPKASTDRELSASRLSRRVRIEALTWQGLFNRLLGRAEIARQLLQQSLDLIEESEFSSQDVRLEKAFALLEMSWIESWFGNVEQSRQLAVQSLSLSRALGDRWATANALWRLGETAQSLGEYDEAIRLHQEALDIRRALGDQRGIAESLREVGSTLANQGQFEEAERLMHESVAVSRELADRVPYAYALGRLASVLAWEGEFAESLSVLEECLALCDDLGYLGGLAWAHSRMGATKADLGHRQEIHVHLQRALALARRVGQRWWLGTAMFRLGQLALAEEQYTEAQQWLRESVSILQEIGHRSDVGKHLAHLAGAERELGRSSEARKHLCKALYVSTEVQDVPTQMHALPVAALLLADVGQVERAVEIYALAARYPRVARSRWFEDVYGKQIAAAAESLPSEVAAAAEKRGRARDLWATVEELLAAFTEGE